MSQLKESRHLKIPFAVIQKATKNFDTCIGKGGYGPVYKGELLYSGKPTKLVAVKRLNEQFGQGLKEFLTEIQLLDGQWHPNVVSLLGYCDEGKEKILVYEFAERGSLDQYIRRRNTSYTMTWLERLKVCVHAARGLHHLHNHAGEHESIIHRDIKSANILIDQNWIAKIADFGLSKLSLAARGAVITLPCGTLGYCDPEYISTGIVQKESDVYSFGMVLFEVLCGRLCAMKDEDGLVLSGPLVKDYYKKKKLDEIVDPSLREQMNSESMKKFTAIAFKCLEDKRVRRPPMILIVKELEESLEIELSAYNKEATRKMRLKKIRTIFERFDINKDGSLNKEEAGSLMRATNPDIKVSKEHISKSFDLLRQVYGRFFDGEKGITFDGVVRSYDDGFGDLDREFAALGLDLKPNNKDKATS